jgi:hypothetical protein
MKVCISRYFENPSRLRLNNTWWNFENKKLSVLSLAPSSVLPSGHSVDLAIYGPALKGLMCVIIMSKNH